MGIDKEQVFDFLDSVRESGSINMMGAGPLIEDEFSMSREEASDLLMEWLKDLVGLH